jgi:hypothetical protein
MEIFEPLEWKRTGKITMRCELYLIIRYPDQGGQRRYTALYGPQSDRVTLAQGLPTLEAAKAACEQHRQKNTASE